MAPEAVMVVDCPEQMVLVPDTVTVGVGFTVTLNVEVPLVPQLLEAVTVTVCDPVPVQFTLALVVPCPPTTDPPALEDQL